MMTKALIAGIALMIMLSIAPLPFTEEGTASVGPGAQWSHIIEISSPAHVTCIVRPSSPADVAVVRADGADGGKTITLVNGTTLFRFTEALGQGTYRIVVNNPGGSEASIEYQVHQDFIVVANMTAKNVMALSLALAMGIVAVLLYARPWRA